MPTQRIPLVGTYNTRGIDGVNTLTQNEDQRFLNCTFNLIQNPVTGKATIYVEKRPGWGVDSLVAAGSASTGMVKPQAFDASISAYGDTNSVVYFGTTNVGTITGRALHFTETLISAVSHVMIKSSDGTGWYYVNGAKDQTAYVGDTHTNTIIDNIASTAGMYIGQAVSGTDIVAGTRIATITSATAITVDQATTGTTASVAITKTPIAKILDTDFVATGASISAFAEMDGYLFYANSNGYVYNSDLNSVTSYGPNARLAVQMAPDPPVGIARQKNALILFGSAAKEVFYNAGLSSGSPLQRIPQAFERIGCLDQRSITNLENEIFYVSTPHEGDIGAYRIKDLASQRISTPNVDRIIGTGNTIFASSFRLGGYPYAMFTASNASEDPELLLLESGDAILKEDGDNILLEANPAQTVSFVRQLVYNATLNLWSEWDASEATFIDGISSGSSNVLLATSRFETGGKIYKIDPVADGELYRDDGSSYTMEIRTSRIDHGTSKRKFIPEIKLVSDRQSTGTATLEASDDNYTTWYTLGSFDMTLQEPKITRCGSYKGGRAYRLRHSDNAPFRAESLEITYAEATG
jgi:hypothetical protein